MREGPEQPTQPSPPPSPAPTVGTLPPETGDESQPVLWALLAAGVLAALGLLAGKRRKRAKQSLPGPLRQPPACAGVF